MISIVKKTRNSFGIDGAIAYTIFSRIIQAIGGLLSIVFIAKFLTPDEQGYYYTFASILAIQVFFELGLSGIITQYTAHEFAHLSWTSDLQLSGEEYYKSRLSSLLRFCVKWFAVIAVILFFVLLAAGFYFFSHYNKRANIEWKNPWIILCLTTALNLFIDPLLAFFEGLGEVKDMAKVRFIQRIVNILLIFVLFLLGFKLYSSAIASLIAISINYIQIFFTNRIKFLKFIWHAKGEYFIDYMKEIFPYQWKIALSWISGYFIFQLFNPVLFATEGAVVAGQMGMTLTALNGVLSISVSWISTKVPMFSNLIAKKEYTSLDKIFNITVKQANIICALFLSILIVCVQILKYNHIVIGNRFLPILPLCLLALSTFLNQYVFAIATYLRCYKQEPFLMQSVVMAVLIAVSTLVFGNFFGVNGITIGYTFLGLLIGFPWAVWIYINKKREWRI